VVLGLDLTGLGLENIGGLGLVTYSGLATSLLWHRGRGNPCKHRTAFTTQPLQLCVDSSMLTYKNANLFDTVTRVIFNWHFCMLLTTVIVKCLSSEGLYIVNPKATCHQRRNSEARPLPPIEMLFQVIRLNFSWDMPKIHYFSNKFSKMSSAGNSPPQRPLIIDFGDLKLCNVGKSYFFKLIMTKSNFKKSVTHGHYFTEKRHKIFPFWIPSPQSKFLATPVCVTSLDKQVSMHAPRFGTQFKQSSKQPINERWMPPYHIQKQKTERHET